MTKKNNDQRQSIVLKTPKKTAPTISHESFVNESIGSHLNPLDVRADELAERHQLPAAESVERLGLNYYADAFNPIEKVNGLIEGIGTIDKQSVLDNVGKLNQPQFGEDDLRAAAAFGKGMAADGFEDSADAAADATSNTMIAAGMATGNIFLSGSGVALKAGWSIGKLLRDTVNGWFEDDDDEDEDKDKATNGNGSGRPAPDDNGGGDHWVPAGEVAKSLEELGSWINPSSTPGFNDESDPLIGSTTQIVKGIKGEKQGKWGANDYYNDEGSYSINQKDVLRIKDMSVNWGDEVLPVGGPTPAAGEGSGNEEPEPEPIIGAAADPIF